MEKLLAGRTPIVRPEQGNDSNRTIVYTPTMGTIDNRESADKIMALVMDLIDNLDYLPYFYKRLYAIGPYKFLEASDLARKVGIKKGRKFTQLIK